MKNTLSIISGLVVTGFATGINKIFQYKNLINQFKVELLKIKELKVNVLENTLNFKADIEIHNPTSKDFNLQTANLVRISKVKFYDQNNALIAVAAPNISSFKIFAKSKAKLTNIPFQSRVTDGLSKVKSFLSNANNENVSIELEIEAFNKKFTTKLK